MRYILHLLLILSCVLIGMGAHYDCMLSSCIGFGLVLSLMVETVRLLIKDIEESK